MPWGVVHKHISKLLSAAVVLVHWIRYDEMGVGQAVPMMCLNLRREAHRTAYHAILSPIYYVQLYTASLQ